MDLEEKRIGIITDSVIPSQQIDNKKQCNYIRSTDERGIKEDYIAMSQRKQNEFYCLDIFMTSSRQYEKYAYSKRMPLIVVSIDLVICLRSV